MKKQALLDYAEVADAWRIVPRVILAGYAVMVYQSQAWFFALPDPSAAQSAYVSVLWGAAAALTGFYFNTGRRWSQ